MTNTRPHLIGLIGRAQSGKDTTADVLVEEYGFTRLAFGDPLKEAALALDPIVHVEDDGAGDFTVTRLSELVELHGWDVAKVRYPEVRRTLQRIGTDVVRRFSPNAWVDDLVGRLECTEGPVVVTDVRFPNEAGAIVHRGGTIVRVVRTDAPATVAHASEYALDGWQTQHTLVNDADLPAFRRQVRRLAHTLDL